MDLLDFSGEELYFSDPLSAESAEALDLAAQRYSDGEAESPLMRAYFLEPEHLTVLVALYRFFYYQHRYGEALLTAERAMAVAARRLRIDADWHELDLESLATGIGISFTLTRFYLLALKGSGYLLLRMGDLEGALERLDKVVELDSAGRLGAEELATIARAALTGGGSDEAAA